MNEELISKQPISNVQWWDVSKLEANDYNPNHVMGPEMQLLEHSILTNGWIQPILVNPDGIIIDGFHRATLAKQSKKLIERYSGKVPVVVMDILDSEAMLLTVRINRAKGTHASICMSSIVKKLIDEHDYTPEQVGQGIGASKHEIELLYQGGVFKARDIKNHQYSKAWIPKETNHENRKG